MNLNNIVFLLFAMAVVLISSLDIYIPISPQLAEVFSVSESIMKLTFLVGPFASGLMGIPVGYLSDRYGRRPLLLLGFLFYLTGTSFCAFSSSIDTFFIGRVLQSTGAGGLLVLSSTILSDLFTGPVLARYMGLYALLFPFAFATAPIVGAYAYSWFGWQANFYALLLAIAPVAILLAFFLPETRKEQNKGAIIPLLKELSGSKWVLSLSLTHAVPITICAIFTINGAFLYSNLFEFDPISFSVVQAIPVSVQCVGTLIYRRVVRDIGLKNALKMGSWVAVTYAVMCLLMIFEVFHGPWVTVSTLCMFTLGITFIITSAATLLLDSSEKNKGLTASFLNLVRNIVITIVLMGASFLSNDSIVPIFSAMFLISLITLVLISIVRQELKNKETITVS
jgi:DHA1 family bicyclomycin/chloramphenicol resistance-like MFS transporter